MPQSRRLLRFGGDRVLIMAKRIINQSLFFANDAWLEHRDLGDSSLRRYR
jgi:hypothetical protein